MLNGCYGSRNDFIMVANVSKRRFGLLNRTSLLGQGSPIEIAFAFSSSKLVTAATGDGRTLFVAAHCCFSIDTLLEFLAIMIIISSII